MKNSSVSICRFDDKRLQWCGSRVEIWGIWRNFLVELRRFNQLRREKFYVLFVQYFHCWLLIKTNSAIKSAVIKIGIDRESSDIHSICVTTVRCKTCLVKVCRPCPTYSNTSWKLFFRSTACAKEYHRWFVQPHNVFALSIINIDGHDKRGELHCGF